MGTVHAMITIKNYRDIDATELGCKAKEEIRQATVEAVADTGAPTLIITEELRQQLGLGILFEWPVFVANGSTVMAKRTEGVEIHWEDRSTICRPYVLPGGREILLGVIPMEDMDLIVDPLKEQLVGAHGDEIVHRIPTIRLHLCKPQG